MINHSRNLLMSGGDRSPRCIMVKMLECGSEVSEFEIQSCYYVHFQLISLEKDIEPFYLPQAMGQIVTLLIFYKDRFGIK